MIALVIPTVAIISVAGYFYFGRSRTAGFESIVVLPFQNVSNDPSVEYLSEGIAESLISSLTQLHFITDPLFDSIRSDPRYVDLLRRMGLKP